VRRSLHEDEPHGMVGTMLRAAVGGQLDDHITHHARGAIGVSQRPLLDDYKADVVVSAADVAAAGGDYFSPVISC
jgi:hypothetical protein